MECLGVLNLPSPATMGTWCPGRGAGGEGFLSLVFQIWNLFRISDLEPGISLPGRGEGFRLPSARRAPLCSLRSLAANLRWGLPAPFARPAASLQELNSENCIKPSSPSPLPHLRDHPKVVTKARYG